MSVRGLAVLGVALSATTCGEAGAPPNAPVAPATGPSARRVEPKSRVDEIAGARAYDAEGAAAVCAPPQPGCTPIVDSAFEDRCRLKGFQVRRCGCELRCSGDAAAASVHYDAAGNAKTCAPASADCTPPQASGALQDACAERGFRLDTCGCEWLCSGKPTR